MADSAVSIDAAGVHTIPAILISKPCMSDSIPHIVAQFLLSAKWEMHILHILHMHVIPIIFQYNFIFSTYFCICTQMRHNHGGDAVSNLFQTH